MLLCFNIIPWSFMFFFIILIFIFYTPEFTNISNFTSRQLIKFSDLVLFINMTAVENQPGPGISLQQSDVFETSDLPESDQYYFPGTFILSDSLFRYFL